MGFVQSQEALDRYYQLGDRRFEGARMLGVMLMIKPEIIARLLPPPLEPPDSPNGMIFIAQYPATNLGPGYRESALFINCQYKGEQGSYCLSMPITDEARMHNGRIIFGFPKRMADIHFERKGEKVSGWVERKGVRFLEINAEVSTPMPALPPMGPTFLFKAFPRIDLTPGFDGPVMLCKQRTEVEMLEMEIGSAELILRPSETDPWHELDNPEIVVAYHITSNNTMLPGEVVTEVDPEAFLPYYYKMTDFYSGK